jgi:hypothetical protein
MAVQAPQALQALQAALAAEDAAIYGYGVAGAHLSGDQQAAAQQYWTRHRQARDALTDMITARDATPVAALAYYDLPVTVTSAATAATLAATLEDGVTAAYLGMVAVDSRQIRQYGALAMQDCAVRAAYWRGSTVAFPGLPLPKIRTACGSRTGSDGALRRHRSRAPDRALFRNWFHERQIFAAHETGLGGGQGFAAGRSRTLAAS